MVRLFGKPRRPEGGEPAVEPEIRPEAETPPPASRAFPMPRRHGAGNGEAIELRTATPEEIAAPILFEGDLLGLGQLLPNPVVAPPIATEPAAPTPEPAALIGFFEHFEPGVFIAGWAGDPDEPACRTLRVAALVDGAEVANTIADRARADTVYGGFEIPFANPDIAALILEDRLSLQVTRDGKRAMTLPALPSVADLARMLRPQQEPEKETPVATVPVPPPAPIMPVPATAGDLSAITVPVGLTSRDGAAIVGRQGFLFGYGGEHDLIGQYRADPGPGGPVQGDAAKWYSLIRTRQAALAERKIAFLQTIIPDKATALTGLAPEGLGPITPRLGVLEAMIETVKGQEGADAVAGYRSLVAALRAAHAAGIKPFLRFDSHLSAVGTQMVFHQLIQKMGMLLPAHASQFSVISEHSGQMKPGRDGEPFSGDLAAHFDFPLYECETIPNLSKLREFVIGKPTFARLPKKGSAGTRLMWSNPKAPSGLRVMAFGTSAFGAGSTLRNLSWWFKTMFAEFHFVWEPELDPAYIDQHKPDLVIGQGIEHLMLVIPAR